MRNRIINKRIHVRVEHVNKSRCREDFLNRVRKNEQLKAEAKKAGSMHICTTLQCISHVSFPFAEKLPAEAIKRLPAQPKAGGIVKAHKTEIQTIAPVKFEYLF